MGSDKIAVIISTFSACLRSPDKRRLAGILISYEANEPKGCRFRALVASTRGDLVVVDRRDRVPVATIAATAVIVLLTFVTAATPQNQIELIKVGLTVGAGTGGVVALVLSGRRQWSTEHDSIERRLGRVLQVF